MAEKFYTYRFADYNEQVIDLLKRVSSVSVETMKIVNEMEGYCLYCNNLFSQKEIGRHLATHLAGMEKEAEEKSAVTYCHVEVEADEMFLHLLVKGDA